MKSTVKTLVRLYKLVTAIVGTYVLCINTVAAGPVAPGELEGMFMLRHHRLLRQTCGRRVDCSIADIV